jgi:hypothetical protein
MFQLDKDPMFRLFDLFLGRAVMRQNVCAPGGPVQRRVAHEWGATVVMRRSVNGVLRSLISHEMPVAGASPSIHNLRFLARECRFPHCIFTGHRYG